MVCCFFCLVRSRTSSTEIGQLQCNLEMHLWLSQKQMVQKRNKKKWVFKKVPQGMKYVPYKISFSREYGGHQQCYHAIKGMVPIKGRLGLSKVIVGLRILNFKTTCSQVHRPSQTNAIETKLSYYVLSILQPHFRVLHFAKNKVFKSHVTPVYSWISE